jgi:hypothetical protein
MNKTIKPLLVLNVLFLLTFNSYAQVINQVEMADTFRAEGKIYVVVVVALIILVGIFAYLIRIDRKVSDLEKKTIEKNN